MAKEKIMLGLAFYGRGFTLSNAAENAVGSKASGPNTAGKIVTESGMLSYFEVIFFFLKTISIHVNIIINITIFLWNRSVLHYNKEQQKVGMMMWNAQVYNMARIGLVSTKQSIKNYL